MKILVLVPVHAPWHVAELTIGSFLKHHRHHDVDVHVGLHLNFCDYTPERQMFEDLRGIAQIHMVEEIDWGAHRNSFFRYSTMHSKNLVNLIIHAAYYNFDRLVILDHDLQVKAPFVDESLTRFPEADLITAPCSDPEIMTESTTDVGQQIYFLPKGSVWHTVLTRKAFDKIMENPLIIYPRMLEGAEKEDYSKTYGIKKDLPVFVDTFADVLHKARHGWNLTHGFITPTQFAQWVRHFSGSSFNWGLTLLGNERYHGRMQESLKLFKQEFPEGLRAFLSKKNGSRRKRNVDSGDQGSHDRKNVGTSL